MNKTDIFEFDKEYIEKQCDDFYSLYSVTKDKAFEMCMRKKIHTKFVAGNCYAISKELRLGGYDCDMAWVIGQLHDFARFGQAVVTKTFRDSERYDHAKMAVRLLFAHGMIEDIIPRFDEICPEDRTVIEKAILYHSELNLPDDLTARERLFCDIIREADRIDIFRTIAENSWETIYGCDRAGVFSSEISDEIMACFDRYTLVDHSKRKTPADCFMAHIALVFGLKTTAAVDRCIEQGYLAKLMDNVFADPVSQKKFDRAKALVKSCLSEYTVIHV